MKLAPDFGIVGYTDRWTYRPGDEVALHLSAAERSKARVRLHRFRQLVHTESGGLDLIADDIAETLDCDVAPQATLMGSWFKAPLSHVDLTDAFTLAFYAMPTSLAEGNNGLFSLTAPNEGLSIVLQSDGHLALYAGDTGSVPHLLPGIVRMGQWIAISLMYRGDRCAAEVEIAIRTDQNVYRSVLALVKPLSRGRYTLRLARCDDYASHSFDGRLEAPRLWRGRMSAESAFAALDSGEIGADIIAAWDFSRQIDSPIVEDIGPQGLHGRLFNLPTRAVKGSRWSGTEQNYRHAPQDYAAIHFHQDDLEDARWPVSARLRLPDDLASGIYLIEVAGEAGRDTLPIVVRPAKPKAKLVFLASTFTWLAYANDRCLLHANNPEMFGNRLLVLTPGDCALAAHPEYGLSLYDTHHDGSGVAYASRRRPCLTLRHTQHAWQGGLGISVWNFSADLLILSWLDREGIAYDIVADDDLDMSGAAALAPYRCVMTGSHPEYHTLRSIDAITAFSRAGGRLIYLGGNGFYWRVSTSVNYPEAIELRRAEDGNRSWAAEPGEYYHAFDGAYGGLWRRNGRPPQALFGVGYTGQGFYRSHPYRLNAAVGNPRCAFLFDQPPPVGTVFGGFGLNGGGAAGIEIDRADRSLGTPDHALILATAAPLDDSYVLANEEVLVNRPTVVGELSPLLRTDLVFYETAAGGAVLSTGSIAWAGSLGDPRPDNEVAKFTRRLVDRFLDPAPFRMP